jgi:hypothetical protein
MKKIVRALGGLAANPLLSSNVPATDGILAISGAPNRKFKSVAILPLWLKRHTSLKNLKSAYGLD